MASTRMLTKAFVLAALSITVFGQIDISAVAEAGPPPTPVIATNVPSQVIKYDHVAVETAAAAEQSQDATSDDSTLRKRNPCDPQWLGKGPVPTPDTVEAFQQMSALSDATNNAPTPRGYKVAYKNLNASANALGYMGFTLLDTYDVLLCASKCDVIDGCAAININFERSPSKDPSPSGGACEQPPSTNLIKCVFWGGPVNTANAVNDGQWRNNYHVIAAGSNGYVNQTVDDVTGYTIPGFLGSRIMNPPNDCNNESSLVGSQYWNDGKPFDTRRCSAACNAQLSADPDQPCYFFNTYIVNKNGQPQGQYCALYSQQWRESDGTQDQVLLNGDRYTFSYSYYFTNSSNTGLPCAHKEIVSSSSSTSSAAASTQSVQAESSSASSVLTTSEAETSTSSTISSTTSSFLSSTSTSKAPSWTSTSTEPQVEAESTTSTTSTSTSPTSTEAEQSTPTSSPSSESSTESEVQQTTSSTSAEDQTSISTTVEAQTVSTTSVGDQITRSTPGGDQTSSSTSEDSQTSSTTSPTSEDTPSSTTTSDSCSSTSAPGQILTAPGCDPLWTLHDAIEDGVNEAGMVFSASILCGSLNQSSVAVFLSGQELPASDYTVDGNTVTMPNGIYGPGTVSFMGLDTNGYPFISSFDLIFGGQSLYVSVVDDDYNAVPNCEVHVIGSADQSFSVTMTGDEYGSATFDHLPNTDVNIRVVSPDGRYGSLDNFGTIFHFAQVQLDSFGQAQDANWDFSDGSKNGWNGDGELFASEQYPCLQSEGICNYDEPIQFPDPLPWWPGLPWGCDSPDQFFGCFCFGFEDYYCGLDFYCDDDNICLPFLPCCIPILLKRETGGSTIPKALLERQGAAASSSSSQNGNGTQYGAVANMTHFISKLTDNVKLRKNGSEVIDVSNVQKTNVSTILTTLSNDPSITPDANVTDGVTPVANITRKRDTSAMTIFSRDVNDQDLFIRTDGLAQKKNSATFNIDSSTKAVFIRFKFVTSEFRRVFSTNDDDFRVSIKSDKGDSVVKTGSVNTLPRYQFDENGATDWMELKLTLAPGSSKVQFDMMVENRYDSDYDSALVIDKAGAIGCDRCGDCSQCSSDPMCSDSCSTQQYGTCTFFSDCMEVSRPCYNDSASFALDFGERNCQRYTNSPMAWQLSGQGHYFADQAMNCVQDVLRPAVNCDATCSNLEQIAFGSQKQCYLDSGFCTQSGLTCKDYALSLMTLGHEKRMFDTLRDAATTGDNCVYAIKTNLNACYDWDLSPVARDVVWAAYFGTSYTSPDPNDPCVTSPSPPASTPEPTPISTPTPTPTQDPTTSQPSDSEPTTDPAPGGPSLDPSQYACSNVGQCGTYSDCGAGNDNGDECVCGTNVGGTVACFRGATLCLGQNCNVDSDCGSNEICLNANSCCGYPVCAKVDVCVNPLNSREIFRKRVVDENGEEWTATYRPKSKMKE